MKNHRRGVKRKNRAITPRKADGLPLLKYERNSKKLKSSSVEKRHRFESFRNRFNALDFSVEDCSRERDAGLNEDQVQSYSDTCLRKWQDLNISTVFVKFVRDIRPKTESLAQILHFKDDIFGALATNIALHDIHSLEPLLEYDY